MATSAPPLPTAATCPPDGRCLEAEAAPGPAIPSASASASSGGSVPPPQKKRACGSPIPSPVPSVSSEPAVADDCFDDFGGSSGGGSDPCRCSPSPSPGTGTSPGTGHGPGHRSPGPGHRSPAGDGGSPPPLLYSPSDGGSPPPLLSIPKEALGSAFTSPYPSASASPSPSPSAFGPLPAPAPAPAPGCSSAGCRRRVRAPAALGSSSAAKPQQLKGQEQEQEQEQEHLKKEERRKGQPTKEKRRQELNQRKRRESQPKKWRHRHNCIGCDDDSCRPPSLTFDAGPAPAPDRTGPASSRRGRSQLFVAKICCASEIPAIQSIVRPIDGVTGLSVSAPTKMVYIDHDFEVAPAADIAEALAMEGFGAEIVRDAGEALSAVRTIPRDHYVRSILQTHRCSLLPNDVAALVGRGLEGLPEGRVRTVGVEVEVEIEGEVEATATATADCGVHQEECPGKGCANSQRKNIVLEHNPYYVTAANIVALLKEEGLTVVVQSDGSRDGAWALDLMKRKDKEKIEVRRATVRWPVLLSGFFWIISMLSYIPGGRWAHLSYVGVVGVIFGLPQIMKKAFRTLRRCQFDANCMMMTASLGALALQEFPEAAAITFLFSSSEALESRASAKARNALAAIVSQRPDTARVINSVTNETVLVPANTVAEGTLVEVRAGDKAPADGIVTEGETGMDESNLTGESRPVQKVAGDTVNGGTVNSGQGAIKVRTTAKSDDSAMARLISLVEEAQTNRSETEQLIDNFARWYTPIILIVALGMCTIPWALGPEIGRRWTMNGLVAIVVACPCALIISTPVTYVAGLAAAAQQGVIVRGGAYLEALAAVKEIAFDKTGTLTEGVFGVLHLKVIGNRSRREVLEHIALMEASAPHPVATALVKAAAKEGVNVPKHMNAVNHTILPGEGITASVDGKAVYIGNATLFKRLGMYNDLPAPDREVIEEWTRQSGMVGFLSIEGEGVVGAYCVADAIRAEAESTVQILREEMGIEVTMLTGDQRPAALDIGRQIGLGEGSIKSQLLPKDKMDFISKAVEANKGGKLSCFKSKDMVLMCGDGINDAPALAVADVSVAGAALAMSTSDITLMDSSLEKLVYALRLGKRVTRTIVENVTFALLAKFIVMGFTFSSKASLWAAIVTDVGSMIIVTLNGMKLLPSRSEKKNTAVMAAKKER